LEAICVKKRIWELDALRGFFIWIIMFIHLSYDLVELFGVMEPVYPKLYAFQFAWGGTPFLVIAGISATLGSHPAKRALKVIGGGMLCTIATLGMYLVNFAGKGIIIYFGVLHCIGTCMLLWVIFRKCPYYVLGLLGAILAALGLYFKTLTVSHPYLILLGLSPESFVSSDYFPLLPNLGYFLVGAMVGKLIYKRKQSLFPRANEKNPVIRFFCFCGRHSLAFYLIHQPVLAGSIWLFLYLV
jgi:uncharacterized membrane protein